jgi:hypothetical protein
MKTLEDVFIKEFKDEVSNIGYKDIYKMPLPPECSNWEVSGTDLFAVKGIEKEYFNLLDKTIVRRPPSGFVVKRRVIDKVTRSYKKGEDGSFVYEDYTVPNKSMVVISDKKIDLPYKDYKYPSKDGYGYIDFIQKGDKVEYLYVLPKTVLYKINQTALALSVKNMKDYWGRGIVTWAMGTVFLHIIPYKPNSQYIGTKILKTGYTLDYSKDLNTLLRFWQITGVIPNLALTVLSDGSNIALKDTVVGYESYVPVDNVAYGDKEIYGSEIDNGVAVSE